MHILQKYQIKTNSYYKMKYSCGKTFLLFVYLFLSTIGSIFSNTSFSVITSEVLKEASIDITKYGSIFVDSTELMSIEEVKKTFQEQKFKSFSNFKTPGKFAVSDNIYWLTFTVDTPQNQIRERVLNLPWTNSCEVFQFQNDSLINHHTYGKLIPLPPENQINILENRKFTTLNFYSGKQSFFIKMDASSLPNILSPSLQLPAFFAQNKGANLIISNYLALSFCTVLFFILIYCFIRYFQEKDQIYLVYGLYILMLFLMSFRTLDLNNPIAQLLPIQAYNYRLVILSLILVYVTYNLFIKHFFKNESGLESLNKYIYYANRVLLISIPIFMILEGIDATLNWKLWTRFHR